MIENNWRQGKHRLQRINCESENSKGFVLLALLFLLSCLFLTLMELYFFLLKELIW